MRNRIVQIARAELGQTWPRYGGPADSWCGAFVAWVIGQAGLRTPRQGDRMGAELVSWLGRTTSPQVGDIALHSFVDHYSIVSQVDHSVWATEVRVIEGRNYDYPVTENIKSLDRLRFFSIDRLLEEYEYTGASPGPLL
jgi:hypothetical protein